MAGLETRSISLPPEAPTNLIVTPTMNRWQSAQDRAALPAMIESTQRILSDESLSQDTWMVIGDASSTPNADSSRLAALQAISLPSSLSRLFVLTPDRQRAVADRIADSTKIRKDVVDAVLTWTGYASQRAKLDAVAGSFTLREGRTLNVLGLDDDVIIPTEYAVVRESALPEGVSPLPNSQVLFKDEAISPDMLEMRQNTIRPFFDLARQSIREVKTNYPGMRATRGWRDTMHIKLEEATELGHAQFEVTHNGEDFADADQAQVAAVTATKSDIPDYRTVKIAEATFQAEFPEQEVPLRSIPSGRKELFAFLGCTTNVDSANISRSFDERTSQWPWWFISSLQISQQNPLKTVTAHYRADNELLPVLLEQIYEKTGEPYMYLSGIETQVLHKRARSGYRPDIHEQAAASLVGNIAALEAAQRLTFDMQTGAAHMSRVEADYIVPKHKALDVYTALHSLSATAMEKIAKFTSLKANTNDSRTQAESQAMIDRYHAIYTSIRAKIADEDFTTFHQHLNREIRDQLNFYSEVAEAMPVVTAEVGRLIHQGEYPVVEYTNNTSTTNYPTGFVA